MFDFQNHFARPCAVLLGVIVTAHALPEAAHSEVKQAMKASDTVSKCVGPSAKAMFGFGPNCKETIVRAGRPSKMSYNKTGLRDQDYSSKPREGWTRILFLGSSVVAGPGIAAEETPPKRLEARLRKFNKKVEVINAGVEGYSSIQLAALTPGWIKEYNPTHVLLFLNIGQSANADPMNAIFAEWAGDESVSVVSSIFHPSKKIAELMNWDLNQYPVRKRLLTMQGLGNRARVTISCRLRNRTQAGLTACMLETTLRSILSVKRHAEGSGAKFLFVAQANPFTNDLKISPGQDLEAAIFFDRFTPFLSFSSDQIKQVLNQTGLPLWYFEAEMNSSHLLPGDYHMNPRGADRIAEVLEATVADFIKK